MADVNIERQAQAMSISNENMLEKYRKCKATSNTEKRKECFSLFDVDKYVV